MPDIERSGDSSPAAGEDHYAVLGFADAGHTSEFVMRFCEALGDHGCARSLDRFGEMELWIGPEGAGFLRPSGGSALYASPGAVRAFEELEIERAQIGWVSEAQIPADRSLVFRYEPGAGRAAS